MNLCGRISSYPRYLAQRIYQVGFFETKLCNTLLSGALSFLRVICANVKTFLQVSIVNSARDISDRLKESESERFGLLERIAQADSIIDDLKRVSKSDASCQDFEQARAEWSAEREELSGALDEAESGRALAEEKLAKAKLLLQVF